MTQIISFISVIIMIGVIVFFHEFGHFLIAKKNGVTVTEFSIGMGPKMFSKVKNGTNFVVRWIPFGGYCLMLGSERYLQEMNDEGEELKIDEEHAYNNKPVWSRMAITVAGPIFNAILTFVLCLIIIGANGIRTNEIGRVYEGTPAEEAGLQAGDEIISLNGKKIHQFQEIPVFTLLNEGNEIDVVYSRNGERKETSLTPVYDEESDSYLMGISAADAKKVTNPIFLVKQAWYNFKFDAEVVFKSMKMLFTGKIGLDGLSGPVGMYDMVEDTVEIAQEATVAQPFYVRFLSVLFSMMNLAAIISVNLGIMNMLPIPTLDGGKLILLGIEGVMGKPVPKKVEGALMAGSTLALMILMVIVLGNDIIKLFR